MAQSLTSVKVLEDRLHRSPRRITLSEAAALTGLSVRDAEHALRDLLVRYECRLQVTENGDLIYDFGETLNRRGEKTTAEQLEEVLDWLWKAFTVAYKTGIAVTLVVYCIIFAVLLIGLMLREGGKRHGSAGIQALVRIFAAIFEWSAHSRIKHEQTRKREADGKPKKEFIPSVYDFVFGPPREEPDPLANLRKVSAYLRQNKGVVVTSELKALLGMESQEAAAFLAECVARFQGDLNVSDTGVMYAQFDQMLRTINPADTTSPQFCWETEEAPYELTGNSPGYNWLIGGMNAFNLVMSFALMVGLVVAIPPVGILLGWVPHVFSALFFVIPAVRSVFVRQAEQQRQFTAARNRVMRVIFEQGGAPMLAEEMVRAVNIDRRQSPLSFEKVTEILEHLVKELPGERQFPGDGRILYAFPAIQLELNAIAQVRQSLSRDDSLGQVVFDSNVEPTLEPALEPEKQMGQSVKTAPNVRRKEQL
ncbi:MAG TPA: hypothetical protein PLB18_11045 [Acidobacteriota bacterium]|nr:hypothetical protein [Acidobacteriota bacterium]